MGGAVSSGQNNDELIDNLKEADYIKTSEVERVFRIVDRAHYYLSECRDNAYKDLAWKSGTLHLSAPCIYSEVMEALELRKGMSFLNLGSGTGYLNTMVGLMIGPYGVNHGIELHADNVKYANEKLESFVQTSKKYDDLELCEPQFVVGNCLNLAPENRLYDRVYCGASCPPEQKETIQNMIKVNGILVIPVGDQLLKIRRMSSTEFSSESVLPVSFASLVLPVPTQNNVDPIVLPEVNPLSLQCICRLAVRSTIRDTFDFNLPPANVSVNVNKTRRIRSPRFFRHEGGRYPLNILPTAQGLMIMGAFDHSEDDEDDDEDEDADASEPSDDNISNSDLDRQLCHHASELRRARDRTLRAEASKTTDDVDSDLSGVDEDDSVGEESQSKDLNGNKSSPAGNANGQQEMVDLMESEGGIPLDSDEKKLEMVNGKESSSMQEMEETVKNGNGARGAKRSSRNGTSSGSRCNRAASASEFSFSNPYEKIADRILTIMSPKKTDESSAQIQQADSPHTSCEPSTSLPSEDEVLVSDLTTRSPAIQVTPITGLSSQPRAIKESYSTSADTSETSGFGSLGDDALHIGSQHSGLGSLKDDMEMISGEDYLPASSIPALDNSGSPWSKSSKGDSSVDNDNTGTDGNDSADAGWMDIEEDDEASDDSTSDDDKEIKKNSKDTKDTGFKTTEDEEEMVDEEESYDDNEGEDDDDAESKPSPRGPDFSAYLKAKVQTLPIPGTLKAFILHYR